MAARRSSALAIVTLRAAPECLRERAPSRQPLRAEAIGVVVVSAPPDFRFSAATMSSAPQGANLGFSMLEARSVGCCAVDNSRFERGRFFTLQ